MTGRPVRSDSALEKVDFPAPPHPMTRTRFTGYPGEQPFRAIRLQRIFASTVTHASQASKISPSISHKTSSLPVSSTSVRTMGAFVAIWAHAALFK